MVKDRPKGPTPPPLESHPGPFERDRSPALCRPVEPSLEDAFHLVKRLRGLAYPWTDSLNGIKLQIWATWLMYAVLADLSDAVAEAVQLPVEHISMEMVGRGPYHFNQAYDRGLASAPVVNMMRNGAGI